MCLVRRNPPTYGFLDKRSPSSADTQGTGQSCDPMQELLFSTSHCFSSLEERKEAHGAGWLSHLRGVSPHPVPPQTEGFSLVMMCRKSARRVGICIEGPQTESSWSLA